MAERVVAYLKGLLVREKPGEPDSDSSEVHHRDQRVDSLRGSDLPGDDAGEPAGQAPAGRHRRVEPGGSDLDRGYRMMHLKSVQIVGDEDGTVQQVLVVVLDNDGKTSSFAYPGKVDTSVNSESNGALSIRDLPAIGCQV
jgi:hypothetical protein